MSIIDTIRTALYGLPPSQSYQPSKEGVIEAFDQVVQSVTILSGGVVGSTATIRATRTLLNAVSAADNTLGLVYNDTTLANNGIYHRSAGTWVFTGLLGAGPQGPGPSSEVINASTATAVSAATSAASSAALAESVSGPNYASTAAGIAATTNGQGFAVDNGDGTVSIYRNTAGVAVLQRRLATTAALALTTGAALVGSNDGAGGTLWTTVAGFISYLRSAVGSSIVGFLQSGTSALTRTIQSKMRDVVSVLDFIPEAEHAGLLARTSNFDTAPAFQAAFNRGQTVHIPKGRYVLFSEVNTQGVAFVGGGVDQTQIEAGAVLDYLFKMSGQNNTSHGVYFEGAGLAKSGVRIEGGNSSCLYASRIEGNTQDGIVFTAVANNSSFSVRNCLIRNNGREFSGGTVTGAAGASTVTFAGAVNLATLGLRAGIDFIVFAGITRPFTIAAINSSTQLQIYPALPSAITGTTFKILQGNNVNIAQHGDNSDIKIDNCVIQNAKAAGILDQALYGAIVTGATYEYNGIARTIGRRDPATVTFGAKDIGAYLEEQLYADFILSYPNGCEITPSLVSTPAHGNHLLFDDTGTATGVIYEYNARKHIGPKINHVNSATIEIYEGVPAYLTQSAGASDIICNLTHTAASRRISEVMDGSTQITFLGIGGKTVTFKTTDGSTVNGVAGAIGVPFTGNYKVLNYKYDVTGWIVW